MPGPGHRGPRGPKPKIENPGKLFRRIIGFMMKDYAPHVIVVVICIFVGVLANVQGTLFMQTLIDSYIMPLWRVFMRSVRFRRICITAL